MSYTPETTVLGLLEGANLNSTSDQAISIAANKYIVRRILFTKASTTPTLATGGVYTGAGKTGSQVMVSSQTFTVLTDPAYFTGTSLGDITTYSTLTNSTLYLSLTTANGSACTVDVYIMGERLE